MATYSSEEHTINYLVFANFAEKTRIWEAVDYNYNDDGDIVLKMIDGRNVLISGTLEYIIEEITEDTSIEDIRNAYSSFEM